MQKSSRVWTEGQDEGLPLYPGVVVKPFIYARWVIYVLAFMIFTKVTIVRNG